MSRLGDRLLLLLLADVGLGTLIVGVLAGAARYWLSGRTETLALIGLAVVFALALIGTWIEFARVDEDADDADGR